MAKRARTRAEWLREKLTYANVMSTLGAFFGIGGAGAYAVDQLGKDSVGAKQIEKGAVRTSELKNRAIKQRDLGPDSIGGSRKIKTGAVHGSDVLDESLGTVDIRDGGVGERDLAFDALQRGDIGGSGVEQSSKLSLTAAFSALAATQVTATSGGLLSLGSLNIENTAAGEASRVIYRVMIDGVVRGGEVTQDLEPGQKVVAPVALLAPDVAPGAHTIELQARVTIGSAAVDVRNLGAIAGIRCPSC